MKLFRSFRKLIVLATVASLLVGVLAPATFAAAKNKLTVDEAASTTTNLVATLANAPGTSTQKDKSVAIYYEYKADKYKSFTTGKTTITGTSVVIVPRKTLATGQKYRIGSFSGVDYSYFTLPAAPTDITLTVAPAAMDFVVGDAAEAITAAAVPADAVITYASSNDAVATVGAATGLVTPVAAGTANITVTATKAGYTTATRVVPVTVTATAAFAVTEIKAISKTKITVTFNKAVDAAAVANFTASVGGTAKTIQGVELTPDKTVATLTVQGLDYGNTVTVTVSGITSGTDTLAAYSGTLTVPAVTDLYELVLTADKSTLTADGADNTVINAKLYDKTTTPHSVVDVEATLTLSATLGGLSYTTVAMNHGIASVVLTSNASAVTVTSFLNATVAAVASGVDGAFVGIAAETLPITFDPAGGGSSATMVTLVNAEASQGDRIIATFSGKITKADFLEVYGTEAAAIIANYGFTVDGVAAASYIRDVVPVNDTTLYLILDTDNFFTNAPNRTDRFESNLLKKPVLDLADTGGYLRDNITHNLSIAANIGTKVVGDLTGKTFIMTDPQKPYIAGVTVDKQMTVYVKFYEPMAEDIAEQSDAIPAADAVAFGVPATDRLNVHFRIDGKPILLTTGFVAATDAELAYANLKNYAVATSLFVGKTSAATDAYVGTSGDERSYVTIVLDKRAKLPAGTYTLQAANVGDWAGMTDPNNIVATQTFDFSVVADTSKPTVTLTKQSPEQWLLTFSSDVDSVAGKVATDVFKVYKADGYAASPKAPLTMGDSALVVNSTPFGTLLPVTPADYIMYAINDDGTRSATVTPGNALPAGESKYLIEFTRDWTVHYLTNTSGENYFTSAYNPYHVVVADVENSVGTAIDTTDLTVQNTLDATSPTIISATDVFTMAGASVNGSPIAATNGQYVYIKMSEPIQMPFTELAGTAGSYDAGDKANTYPETPSQQQTAGTGIPQPTYEFIKGDVTWKGQLVPVAATTVAEDDYSFVIQPIDPVTLLPVTLEAGTWTLVARSISDDVGNTYATVPFYFTVIGTAPGVTPTQVAWIGFDDDGQLNNATDRDILYIKFTKTMKDTGSTGVASTTAYQFNAAPLPSGSTVTKGIPGVTSGWDGVTISMPSNTWGYLVNNPLSSSYTCAVNLLTTLVGADGTAMTGAHEIQVTDVVGYTRVSGQNIDPALPAPAIPGYTGDMYFEAQYIADTNYGVAITPVGPCTATRAIITGSAGFDADGNGKVDAVALRLSAFNTAAAAPIVGATYAGKALVGLTENHAVTANVPQLAALNARFTQLGETIPVIAGSAGDRYVFGTILTQISGTTTSTLTVLADDNSQLVGAGRVLDAALPVITGAKRTGANALTLTFSEGVYTDAAHTSPLVVGDIDHSPLGTCGADLEVLAGITHTAGAATATATTTTATVAATSTVGAVAANSIYDSLGNAMKIIANATSTETLVTN